MKSFLVVPTCRTDSINKFLESWDLSGFSEVIIVEDKPEKTFHSNFKHYSWKEIDEDLKDKSYVISREDSSVRNYGILKAYQMGADYIFTLDDDVRPLDDIFKHIENMERSSKWQQVTSLVTRGIPYNNKGILENVNLSVGGWSGVPDLDGVHSLLNQQKDFQYQNYSMILSHNAYYPICGMNIAFKRIATPIMYFAFMHSGGKRYDDIWMGIVIQKIFKKLNWNISCGLPRVIHEKASCSLDNLKKESVLIKLNEAFWELIEANTLNGNDPIECMLEISDCLVSSKETYFQVYGFAMRDWISLYK